MRFQHDDQPLLDEGIAANAAVPHHDDVRRRQGFIECRRRVGEKSHSGIAIGDWLIEFQRLRRMKPHESGCPLDLAHGTAEGLRLGETYLRPVGRGSQHDRRLVHVQPSLARASAGFKDNVRVRRGQPPTTTLGGSSPASMNLCRCTSLQANSVSARTGTIGLACLSATPWTNPKVGMRSAGPPG